MTFIIDQKGLLDFSHTFPDIKVQIVIIVRGLWSVNFTNILRAAFALIFLCQKSINLKCKNIKAACVTLVRKSCLLNVGEIDTHVTKRYRFIARNTLCFLGSFWGSFGHLVLLIIEFWSIIGLRYITVLSSALAK